MFEITGNPCIFLEKLFYPIRDKSVQMIEKNLRQSEIEGGEFSDTTIYSNIQQYIRTVIGQNNF